MASYYNEIDPFAAAWLRALIKAGQIADGEVDERSIVDVRPDDIRGFAQCHFFAGIGGWSYALRLAGWSDDRPVWTGSCPCQPFSAAGQGRGKDDPRHLWPQFRRLIRQCRPAVVFGEQVASQAGRVWLSAVFADLEALAYRAAGADLCGPSVGAFDIRQRLWFVADAECGAAERYRHDVAGAPGGSQGEAWERQRLRDDAGDGGIPGDMAYADAAGLHRLCASRLHDQRTSGHDVDGCGPIGELADAQRQRSEDALHQRGDASTAAHIWPTGHPGRAGASFWSDCAWIPCSDGKARPVEPGTFPLADGVPARVGRLRGYGNAIKPPVAAAFIESYCEATGIGSAANV